MFTVQYNNKTYNAKLVPEGYDINGNTALHLFQGDTFDDTNSLVVSTNVSTPLPDELICIKNWSEYEGIEQPLIDAGIIDEFTVNYIPSGFKSLLFRYNRRSVSILYE